jgi:hypothetical protein
LALALLLLRVMRLELVLLLLVVLLLVGVVGVMAVVVVICVLPRVGCSGGTVDGVAGGVEDEMTRRAVGGTAVGTASSAGTVTGVTGEVLSRSLFLRSLKRLLPLLLLLPVVLAGMGMVCRAVLALLMAAPEPAPRTTSPAFGPEPSRATASNACVRRLVYRSEYA